MAWLGAEGMSTCLDDVGEDEVRRFILHLQERTGLLGRRQATRSTTGSERYGLSSTGCTGRVTPSATGWKN